MSSSLSTENNDTKDQDTLHGSSRLTRRDAITLAWKFLLGVSGVLGLAGVLRFFSYRSASARPVIFDLGPIEQLPRDTIITISEAQAVIRPVSGGFQAFSLVCPHLGCLVEVQADGFSCPCHGSRFEPDGTVTKGPASQPLSEVQLKLSEEGHLLLDISGAA
jgi:nitrite reductase/ring-hydroxylating ferredoxin subunit